MHPLSAFLLVLLAAPAAAQQVALSEDFSSAQFPPAGWLQLKTGVSNDAWQRDGATQRAWHDYFLSGLCENHLISPPMDLSGFSQAFLHFEGETGDSVYLANHPNSIGNGVGRIQVTTDAGANWTPLWNDTSQNAFGSDLYAPTIDLSAYVGQTNVQISFYYYGDYAHFWYVDNVIVDDTPVPVLGTLTNPNNGHPYFLLGQADFASAQAMALSLGGNLVSIENAQENEWVKTNFGNFGGTQRNLMLGYTDTVIEGSFAWVSGEASLYENWATGEPNNDNGAGGDEDYVEMTSTGEWNDFDDAGGGYGVVEISEARIQTTPLVAGEMATITVNGLRVGSEIIMVFSVNGNGPYNGRYGVMEVDPDLFTPRFPAINGQFNFSTYIPSTLSGRTLYGQGVQFHSDGSNDLSAAFESLIQ